MLFHRLRKKRSSSRSSNLPDKNGLVGILIVNGGRDPEEGKWLDLCLRKILTHTTWQNYRIYVWNNNIEDISVSQLIGTIPCATLLQANPQERLNHIHAVPLQRLYEVAKKDNCSFIVTIDTDAFPFQDNWLSHLIKKLDKRTVICGVWRDELAEYVRPYAHPSCLCTTTNFVEKNRLRFDRVDIASDKKMDTLASFTIVAEKKGMKIYKLRRSNVNELHYIMGGIYGNLVYHHGAGSRKRTHFWGEEKTEAIEEGNHATKRALDRLIFQHGDEFLNWLSGNLYNRSSHAKQGNLIFVLGMHRSGTSCLAGCLEACGLYLGEVSKSNIHNRRGNQELRAVNLLHEKILNRNGGTWDYPPESIQITTQDKNDFQEILGSFPDNAICGIKDPRILFLADEWMELQKDISLIATYRHPLLVAASLQKRNQMNLEKGLSLWNIYNDKLVKLHKKYGFHIIKFCLDDQNEYMDSVAQAAILFGLNPDLKRMKEFVRRELEHEKDHLLPIPDQCRNIYAYLEKNTFTPSQNSFSFHILKVKKDLLQMESLQAITC